MLRLYNQIDIHTCAFELTQSPSHEKKRGTLALWKFYKIRISFLFQREGAESEDIR